MRPVVLDLGVGDLAGGEVGAEEVVPRPCAAIEIGLVPKTGRLPPCGATRASLLVKASPITPWRAIARV